MQHVLQLRWQQVRGNVHLGRQHLQTACRGPRVSSPLGNIWQPSKRVTFQRAHLKCSSLETVVKARGGLASVGITPATNSPGLYVAAMTVYLGSIHPVVRHNKCSSSACNWVAGDGPAGQPVLLQANGSVANRAFPH